MTTAPHAPTAERVELAISRLDAADGRGGFEFKLACRLSDGDELAAAAAARAGHAHAELVGRIRERADAAVAGGPEDLAFRAAQRAVEEVERDRAPALAQLAAGRVAIEAALVSGGDPATAWPAIDAAEAELNASAGRLAAVLVARVEAERTLLARRNGLVGLMTAAAGDARRAALGDRWAALVTRAAVVARELAAEQLSIVEELDRLDRPADPDPEVQ